MPVRDPERLVTGPLRFALALPWICYRPLVRVRNLLFDFGLRRPRQLRKPVISVGNIAVGGTGKTPLVDLICRRLADLGQQPAVLSRGYKSGDDGSNDEARMLSWPVVCDPSRFAGGQRALADGATALVLDDGFQHRQLSRDLDIVCLDATRPWGRSDGSRGRTLPLGLLRESPQALSRAQLVVITRSDQVTPQRLTHIEQIVSRFGLPWVQACHQPTTITTLDGQHQQPASDLDGKQVVAISAIGNPQAFITTLTKLGATVVADHRFPDHHHFTSAELEAARAQDDDLIVVTAKDAAKLNNLSFAQHAKARVLNVSCALRPQDNAVLDQHLRRVLGQQ